MLHRIRHFLVIAALACAAPTLTAEADVRAFNDAVKKGDYIAASAAAKEVWAGMDKTQPDAAVIAAEFGFASLVAGDNQAARDYAKFLVEKGPTLPTPDKAPATSKVLFAVSDFQLGKSPQQLEALRAALYARQQATGFDMISVLAWELLYNTAWARADYASAETDARATVEYLKRVPTSNLGKRRDAEVLSAAAAFVKQRGRVTQGRSDLYGNMADLHDAIVADINAAPSDAARRSLWASKWQSEAWSYAIASFFQSRYEQVGAIINTNVKERSLAQAEHYIVPEDKATSHLSVCDGKFEGRDVRYPMSKQFTGLVGSVIARLETGEDGKVTKVEVLASVPVRGFETSVKEDLMTWTYKPAANAERPCRLNYRNHVYRVRFLLNQ